MMHQRVKKKACISFPSCAQSTGEFCSLFPSIFPSHTHAHVLMHTHTHTHSEEFGHISKDSFCMSWSMVKRRGPYSCLAVYNCYSRICQPPTVCCAKQADSMQAHRHTQRERALQNLSLESPADMANYEIALSLCSSDSRGRKPFRMLHLFS